MTVDYRVTEVTVRVYCDECRWHHLIELEPTLFDKMMVKDKMDKIDHSPILPLEHGW